MTFVFVYGTLMSDMTNHFLLNKSKFIGYFRTKDEMAMYGLVIPFVTTGKKLYPIKGEIYEVNKQVLKKLDHLEGHPDWYIRKTKWFCNEVLETQAYIYMMPYYSIPENTPLIPNGDYKSYRRENGLL